MMNLTGYDIPSVLDAEFDEDREFEAAVIDRIARCGTLDVHPNGWGIHDGIAAWSDGHPEDNRTLEEKAKYQELLACKKAEWTAKVERDKQQALLNQRRLRLIVGRARRKSLRQCMGSFLLESNQWTRSALLEVMEPIVVKSSGCDSVAARCAINEFMDWGRAEADALKKTYLCWLIERVRSY